MLERSHRLCDVTGIDDHTMQNLPIATCAGLTKSTTGPVIVILHQYAYTGKGATIHSSAQIECFGNIVDDRSRKVPGGKQHIVTNDGHILPLQFRNGLPYLALRPPSKSDMDAFPHIILTSDVDWDPSKLDLDADYEDSILFDGEPPDDDQWGVDDSHGVYVAATASFVTHACSIDQCHSYTDFVNHIVNSIAVNKHSVFMQEPHYTELRPNFGYAPINVIKKTFESTTQWARMVERYPFRKHFKSRFPALNVIRRSEPVATDTVFADTAAYGTACRLAQLFVGTKTFVTDIYPMKMESDFITTLQENIRKRGAMDLLISDRAQVEVSERVKELLRHYMIDDWQSEPYHEHQNAAERRYQTVKRCTNVILDQAGAPPEAWLLCMQYACYVLNLLYVDSIKMPPLQALTGQTQDISILLPFHFWESVYYATGDALSYNSKVIFPSQTAEGKERFVGFGESVGDAMTFKILTNDTKRIIFRSSVRSATSINRNLRLDLLEGESSLPDASEVDVHVDVDVDVGDDINAVSVTAEDAYLDTDVGTGDQTVGSSSNSNLNHDPSININITFNPLAEPKFDAMNNSLDDINANSNNNNNSTSARLHKPCPDDLINRTYLTQPDDKGQRFRAKIKRMVDDPNASGEDDNFYDDVQFLVSMGNDHPDELVSYNEVLDHLARPIDDDIDSEEIYWRFKPSSLMKDHLPRTLLPTKDHCTTSSSLGNTVHKPTSRSMPLPRMIQ
jgi:hypothetical protein